MKQVGNPDRALRAGLFLVALLACAAMFRHPGWLAGSYDWRYFESAMEAARRSVVWFGELPLYNPYMCGGEPQLANPQSVAGSPLSDSRWRDLSMIGISPSGGKGAGHGAPPHWRGWCSGH